MLFGIASSAAVSHIKGKDYPLHAKLYHGLGSIRHSRDLINPSNTQISWFVVGHCGMLVSCAALLHM